MPLFTDQTLRQCSRCGSELTDPASRECGVGPICRAKDNHLYAKTIPANLPAASAIVLGTTADQFPPEVQGMWSELIESFIRLMARTEQQTDLFFTGADFRDTVRTIDYMLSFRMSPGLKTRLVKIVGYLGYPGLAGVLSGEASRSAARIWFEGGRVFLEGKFCRPGYGAMCRIPGIRTPRYRGDRTPYSVGADQAVPFLDVVSTYWPMYEGDMEVIRREAAAWATANALAPVQPMGPTAKIEKRSMDLVVRFDWVRGAPMYEMVNAIKMIPAADRKYDADSKVWTVKAEHLAKVTEALRLVYSQDQIVVENTSVETPAGLYDRQLRPSGGGRRYGQRPWRRY